MIKKTVKQGFTLIELAVVIAIVAILAAVAIPRLTDMTASAEKATIYDFKSQLVSAMSMYTAQAGAPPATFKDFVKDTALAAGDTQTISSAPIGNTGTKCTVSNTQISCAGAFKKYTAVTYDFVNGAINGSATTGGVATTF